MSKSMSTAHGAIYLPEDANDGEFEELKVSKGKRTLWGRMLGVATALVLICYSLSAWAMNTRGHLLYDSPSTVGPFKIISVDPPLSDYGSPVYSVDLVPGIEFSNSWNRPYTGNFTAPNNVSFNKVRLSLEASTYGKQFDRLAHLFVGGNELWRLSTAEPGNRSIVFGAAKDVHRYADLFRQDQVVEFYLNNIVDSTYTGPITVNLKADFFFVEVNESSNVQLYDWPIEKSATTFTSLTGGQPILVSESQDSVSISKLPRNTTRAVVEVHASGNANEEFWYSHILDPYSESYTPDLDIGKHGPVREGKVYVNGRLAGGFSPFPVIYTGGYSPYLWSPIVGLGAYDVPSYLVDITPFLPQLWENSSDISIQIVNRFQKSLENNWIVSANLLTWEDASLHGQGTFLSDHHDARSEKSTVTLPQKDTFLEILDTSTVVSNKAMLEWTCDEVVVQSVGYTFNQSWALANVQTLKGDDEESQQLVNSGHIKSTLKIDNALADALSVSSESSESSELTTKDTADLVYRFDYSKSKELYTISIVQSSKNIYFIDNEPQEQVVKSINGTSNFFLNGRSASGAGSTTARFYKDDFVSGEISRRRVDAENGNIVSDRQKSTVNGYSDQFSKLGAGSTLKIDEDFSYLLDLNLNTHASGLRLKGGLLSKVGTTNEKQNNT